jgi:hypothetical protein
VSRSVLTVVVVVVTSGSRDEKDLRRRSRAKRVWPV